MWLATPPCLSSLSRVSGQASTPVGHTGGWEDDPTQTRPRSIHADTEHAVVPHHNSEVCGLHIPASETEALCGDRRAVSRQRQDAGPF